MIPRHKINDILQLLLEKSRAGDVRWTPSVTNLASTLEYLVVLADYQIVLSYKKSPVLDSIVISIVSSSGTSMGEALYEEGEDGWDLVSALFNEAESKVKGWDKVLLEIEEAIKKPGPIGLKATGTGKGSGSVSFR